MQEIMFLEPVFKEMIWGGNRLSKEFHYDISSDATGECWAVSAHQNGDCKVKNGTYQGKSLSELWKNHKELFGNSAGEVFPLLIKIIDAKTDLSIQVHPDDTYAKCNENGSLGKTECWYILDCDQDGEIVVGHNAKDKEELKEMITQEKWTDLIKVRPIKKGDFFQINPGTVHAIKGGTLILETQQSSDVTYRLYDYGRLQDGKPRELHIEKSIDVIECPHVDVAAGGTTITLENGIAEELIQSAYYTVKKLTLAGINIMEQDKPFQIISVIEGNGTINGKAIKKGDHFILPSAFGSYELDGTMQLIVSSL